MGLVYLITSLNYIKIILEILLYISLITVSFKGGPMSI